MSFLMVVIGVVIALIALVDALRTTLWLEGAGGPLTSRVTTGLWRTTLAFSSTKRYRLLSLAGPFILSVTVFMWVVLLGAGWTLVFSAYPDALLDTSTREPADLVGRVWFVFYTIFTLGNGDYTPSGNGYRFAGAAAVASGMFLVTLAITYVLSVISAVANKRAFASQVSGFGGDPEEFVLTVWDGTGFGALAPQLTSLSTSLSLLAELHQAYPSLHYYYAASKNKASAPAVALLDEALT